MKLFPRFVAEETAGYGVPLRASSPSVPRQGSVVQKVSGSRVPGPRRQGAGDLCRHKPRDGLLLGHVYPFEVRVVCSQLR
jgi:hypothetical protein